MKHVLLIAYIFPPLANSGTQRPLKFANYLPDFGWTPTVLTAAAEPGAMVDLGLLREVRPGTTVVRSEMLNDRIAGWLTRRIPVVGQKLGDGLSWRARRLWKMPDPYRLWIPTARTAAMRLHREHRFDAILATGYPWSSLLLGRQLSATTGAPFIADFRDPWTGEDIFAPSASKRRLRAEARLERAVLKDAAAVVTVTETMTDQMRALWPDLASSKFFTITNGYDLEDLRAAAAVEMPSADAVRLVYTGVWKSGYNLESLYAAIASLKVSSPRAIERLEVIAAGFAPGAASRFGVVSHVKELGPIPHAEAVGYMKSAHALFLPYAGGVRRLIALPGKVFEYIAAGAPILAQCDSDGETGRLLRRVGGATVVPPDDVVSLMEALRCLCQRGSLNATPRDERAASGLDRRSLTGQLALVLDALVAGSQGCNCAVVS